MEGCEIYIIYNYFRNNYIGKKYLSFNTYKFKNHETVRKNRYEKELLNDINHRNQTIIDIWFKGKHIFFKLENNLFIHIHYGLNGYLTSKIDSQQIRWCIMTTGLLPIYYADTNNYGYIKFIDKIQYDKVIKRLSNLDPFIPSTFNYNNVNKLFNRLQKSKLTIGEILIDQTYILGLGLYLRSEILLLCHMHPLTKANMIPYDTLYKIVETVYKYLPFFSLYNSGVLLDVFIRNPHFNALYILTYHYKSCFNSISENIKNQISSALIMKKYFFRIHMHDNTSARYYMSDIIKIKIKDTRVFCDQLRQKKL